MRKLLIAFVVTLLLTAAAPGRVAAAAIAVSGRVLAPGGAPLAGAWVVLLPYPDRYRADLVRLGLAPPERPAATDHTDDQGAFRLLAPGDGMWRVEVSTPGRVTMVHPVPGLVEDTDLGPVELAPGAELVVTVTDPGGRPAAGARVAVESPAAESARPRHRPEGGPRGGRPPLPLPFRGRAFTGEPAGSFDEPGWRPAERSGTTDADGRVVLTRAASEELQATAWSPGTAPSEPARSTGASVALRLRAAEKRLLEVHGSDGRPRPGVVLRSAGGGGWPAGVSGEDGRLTAVLAPAGGGRLELAVPEGWTAPLDLPPLPAAPDGGAPPRAAPAATVTLPAPAVVTGTVLNRATGSPIAGALAWVAGAEPALVRADRAGRFRLAAAPGGSLVVAAAAPGYFPSSRAAKDGTAGLELTPAIVLAGAVLDADGLPLAGANVQVRSQRRFPLPWPSERPGRGGEAVTAGDGRWRFRLAAGPAYELRASHDAYAPAEVTVAAGRSESDLAIVLRRGAALIGEVVDRDRRQPVAGARVRVFAAPADQPTQIEIVSGERVSDFEALSAADGSFVIAHLPAQRFDLEVRAAGFAPLALPGITLPAEEGRDLDLGTLKLAPGAVIEGWVTDTDGHPIESAQISLDPLGDPGAGRRAVTIRGAGPPAAVTDRQGYFQLGDLAAGARVNLTVGHPDYLDARLAAIEPPTTEPLQVVLHRGAHLSGIVVDASGGPIAGAQLMAKSQVTSPDGASVSAIGTGGQSGDDGRFTVPNLAPGPFRLDVRAVGFLPWQASETAVEGEELGPLRIELERGTTVEGRVVDGDGLPVPGARVSVRSTASAAETSMSGTLTDADGHYRQESAPTGDAEITAWHPSQGRAERKVQLASGANHVDLTLSRLGSVSGRVLGPGGEPVAGAMVRGQHDHGGDVPFMASAGSDEDGTFLLYLGPGEVRLSAFAPGYAETTYPEVLTLADRPITGIEIRLQAGGEIVGRLLGIERERLATVSVQAGPSRGGRVVPGTVDYQGNYRIGGISPGEWRVSASTASGGGASGRVVMEEGSRQVRLDLDLTGGVTLTGQVLLNGAPLAGVWASLEDEDGSGGGTGRTTFDGRFRFSGIQPGSYVLQLSPGRGGATHQRRLDVETDDDVLIDLVAYQVGGRVVATAGGAPIPGARVVLRPVATSGSAGNSVPLAWVTTDLDGRFTLLGIEAGSYLLEAVAQGYQETDTVLDVGGDVGGLEIPLAVGGGGGDGAPIRSRPGNSG